MRKLIIPFLIILGLISATCHKSQKVEKDPMNYYPKVKTLSVEKLLDGTVRVTGQVVSQGNQPIEYAGFCMDTLPMPDMISNQMIAPTISGDTFSCIYSSVDFPAKYYFRAWVNNSNGYAIGEPIYTDSIAFDTSLIPCRPTLNHMLLTGGTLQSGGSTPNVDENYTLISTLTQSGTGYEFDALTSNHSINLTFGQFPHSGIYSSASVSILVDGGIPDRLM